MSATKRRHMLVIPFHVPTIGSDVIETVPMNALRLGHEHYHSMLFRVPQSQILVLGHDHPLIEPPKLKEALGLNRHILSSTEIPGANDAARLGYGSILKSMPKPSKWLRTQLIWQPNRANNKRSRQLPLCRNVSLQKRRTD
jgi:hypothetical protein